MWDVRSNDSGQFNLAPSESLDEWILRVAAHRSSDLTSKYEALLDTQGKDLVRDIQLLFTVKTIEGIDENLKNSDDKVEIEHQKKRGEEMKKILPLLIQLWWVNSKQLDSATEKLADGCRDSKWRIPIGEAGILKFFLEIFSRHDLRHALKIHILRLIGNCCADTDENRVHIAASKNYILSIIEQLKDASMLPFALPVLFNICVDYVPNQLIAINSFLSRELITLISSSSFDRTQPLLDYIGQILALLVSQSSEAEFAPVDIAAVLFRIAADKTSPIGLDNFISFVSIAISYLQNAKFQRAFLRADGSLNDMVTILEDSYERFDIQSIVNESHDDKALINLRNELNQVLSDISALPEFTEACPISSNFSKTLQQWLVATCPKIQLQVCACIMLGNLARSDTVCTEFIHTLQIHKPLITIVNRENKSQILHAILGFLKNLAIPLENKKPIGEAGIFKALARLWALDTVTQVQFSAISLGRQLTIGTFENVHQLIQESIPNEKGGILSHLGNLFNKTDDEPVKMEIGRMTTSICRVLYSRNESSWEVIQSTRIQFFRMYPEISQQLKFIVSQKKWPVVRSEGWFVLALISRFAEGAAFVSQLIQDSTFFELLSKVLTGNPVIDPIHSPSTTQNIDSETNKYTHHDPEPVKPHAQAAEMARLDLENAMVLISEILQNSSCKMTTPQKMELSGLLKNNGKTLINHLESRVEAHIIMS
ncbi:putative gtp binding protein [Golovinomyces cichoracearum]|uniref:Putative gtp binding protein n=1 Tax=Golovinomyces cichoracearum TaxID=62708 RepID=A0A420ISU0_9PEZI|nr:putative gtp binding protein [Golovinomyces cichoracearum]